MGYMTYGCAGAANQFAAEDDIDAGIRAGERLEAEMPERQAQDMRDAKTKILAAISEDYDAFVSEVEGGQWSDRHSWDVLLRLAISKSINDILHDELKSYETLEDEILK